MKCPKCGKTMYSSVSAGSDTARGNYIDAKYVCPGCGYEVKTTTDDNGMGMIRNFNDLVYREPIFQPNDKVTNYGWICPKCGAVLSPSIQECPYCTPHKVTCGPNNGSPIKLVPLTDVTTQPQVYKGVNNETNNT